MTAANPPTARSTSEAKNTLRTAIKARRARHKLALAAQHDRLNRALELCEGHFTVAVYASVDDEPSTWELIEALYQRDVRVLLPVLAGRRYPDWGWYAGREALRPGWAAIPEPTTPALGADALGEASLVWASALAATPGGDRMGVGGGWYDRALAHAADDAVIAVLLDDADVLDSVPVEPWDRRIDVIVTELRTVWASQRPE